MGGKLISICFMLHLCIFVFEHSIYIYVCVFVFVGFAHGTERHEIYVIFVLLWYVMLCYVV